MRNYYWKTICTLFAASVLFVSTACADVITTFKHGEGKHTIVNRNPDGSRTWTTTDTNGVVTTKTFGRPGGFVEWTDDQGNDHTWTNTQDGHWTRTTISPDGKKTVTSGERLPTGTFIDGSGNRTEISPNADGSRTWVTTSPDGKVTRRVVGKPGGLVIWKDKQGNEHTWTSEADGSWQRITIAPDGKRTVTKGRFRRSSRSKTSAVPASSNQPVTPTTAIAPAQQPTTPLGPIVLKRHNLPVVIVKLSPAGKEYRIEELIKFQKSLKASYNELNRIIRERQKQIIAELKQLRAPMSQVFENRMKLIKEYGNLTDYGRAVGKQIDLQLDKISKEILRIKG